MAQAKPELSKSDIIRDFVTKNPDLSISEVATMLGERGTQVSKNLIYVVKGKMEIKKFKEQREKAEAKAAAKESQAKVAAAASSDGATKAPSKSSAVRAVLKGNRKMMAKDVVSAPAEKGISVTEGLVYFVKGQMKGRKKKASQEEIAQVATAMATAPVMSDGDPLKTILKVKSWETEIGSMKKLKALVDALSE